eukprot:scaffold90263_cov69-Phaeocystis_antarctica.AAC.5
MPSATSSPPRASPRLVPSSSRRKVKTELRLRCRAECPSVPFNRSLGPAEIRGRYSACWGGREGRSGRGAASIMRSEMCPRRACCEPDRVRTFAFEVYFVYNDSWCISIQRGTSHVDFRLIHARDACVPCVCAPSPLHRLPGNSTHSRPTATYTEYSSPCRYSACGVLGPLALTTERGGRAWRSALGNLAKAWASAQSEV